MPYRIGLDIGGAEPIISSNACISVVPPTMNGVRWWMLWGRMSRTGPRLRVKVDRPDPESAGARHLSIG